MHKSGLITVVVIAIVTAVPATAAAAAASHATTGKSPTPLAAVQSFSRVRGESPAGALGVYRPAASSHRRRHQGRPNVTDYLSTNWSGYAVSGSDGSFTSVSSTWVQPAVTCSSSSRHGRSGGSTPYAAFWDGLDGFSSDTVEQTGTFGYCSGTTPKYSAWYEMYPAGSVEYSKTVKPGDILSSSVHESGGIFALILTDSTQRWTEDTILAQSGADLSSAEVISEAPSEDDSILPLADFGTVTFGSTANGLDTVNGSPLTGSTSGLDQITMENNRGALEAQPTAIRNGTFSAPGTAPTSPPHRPRRVR